jgi:hypothetical protein
LESVAIFTILENFLIRLPPNVRHAVSSGLERVIPVSCGSSWATVARRRSKKKQNKKKNEEERISALPGKFKRKIICYEQFNIHR